MRGVTVQRKGARRRRERKGLGLGEREVDPKWMFETALVDKISLNSI